MFYRTILVYLVGFVLVKFVKTDPVKINFTIHNHLNNTLFCDHVYGEINQNKYTVLEGEPFTIFAKYEKIINHLICHDYTDQNNNFNYNKTKSKSETTFPGEKRMGTLWNCTILTLRDIPAMQPRVHYKNENYAAAYCFMKIHVRRKEAPQTILVNNMVVPAVREDQTEKDVDFTAEYHYVDGDIVNVTCVNLNDVKAPLTMEYEMAGIKSDNSTVRDISSSTMIGFIAKLHAGHNNSYMICTHTGPKDYTKVMLRFVMLTKPNIVRISFNGMILRPRLVSLAKRHYEIKYKVVSHQPMNLTCEVERTDVKLLMMDDEFGRTKRTKTELIPMKKSELVSFYLNPGDNKSLACSADNVKGGLAESVYIEFTTANFPIDQFQSLQMKLPSNGTVMELYSYGEEPLIVIILYEFQQDEKLNLTCGPLVFRKQPSPVLYLQLNDTGICNSDGCNVNLTLQPTREHVNTPIVCNLKEEHDPGLSSTTIDAVFKVIKLILREKVSTPSTGSSTSTTSTSTSTDASVVITAQEGISSAATAPDNYPPSQTPENAGVEDASGLGSKLPMIAGSAACAVIICLVIAIIFVVKFRKRNDSQGGPNNRSYENLAEPSETSIPAYPPQWENNYAVPIDRRTDDTTYSVPCPPGDLYATPTPKNLRNKKQKPLDPTYAVLTMQKGQAKKNAFKESEDPNYSEVYANRQEENYAKVLPKSVRNQMEQDNPYSYVTNDPPYVNTGDSEPMYSEVAKAQGAEYANLNSSHYANSNTSEYAEPTYCEPQKRKK